MANQAEERRRITARIPRPVMIEVEVAASLMGISVNHFIAQAAAEKARTVIDAFTRVNLSRRDAAFIATLQDNPPAPNEALQRAARRHKRLRKRE